MKHLIKKEKKQLEIRYKDMEAYKLNKKWNMWKMHQKKITLE